MRGIRGLSERVGQRKIVTVRLYPWCCCVAVLLCCSWKWISKRVLTGWDVKGESNVVQNVG